MKRYLILFYLAVFYTISFSQDFQPGKLWVATNDSVAQPTGTDLLSGSAQLNSIFESFSVQSYAFTMPFAKTEHLRKFAEIQCDSDWNY